MKTKWRVFFGVVILLVLVWLLRKIDLKAVWFLVRQANPLYLGLAFFTLLLAFLVSSFRSVYALKNVVAEENYWFMLRTTFAGYFANTITPSTQIGGDIVRAHFIGDKYKKPKTKIYGVLLAERFYHAATSLFFIVASILFVLTYIPVSRELKTIFQAVLFFILVVIALIFFFKFKKMNFNPFSLLKKLRRLLPLKKKTKSEKNKQLDKILSEHFGNFSQMFKKTVRNKKFMLVAIITSLIYWLLIYTLYYLVFLSFGVKVSFFLVIVVTSLGELVGEISPSPGGIGLIEGTMTFVYSLLGIDFAAALTVSLVSRAIFYLFSVVIGGANLVHLEKTVK